MSAIPDPLRFSATRHSLVDGYEGLYKHLTGDRESGHPDSREQPDSDRFADAIRDRFAKMHLVVERLTQEQYRVIQQLRGQRRALISGCAGSGKTLVAAEKALRLAHAGLTPLFLCHNPLLAEWAEELTIGSGVRVRAFEDLVAEFSEHGVGLPGERWTNYSQPTSETLAEALEHLVATGGSAEAVIVDEGQDFAADWWPLVEACLRDRDSGILYIFFDDRQSLLPFRGRYPIELSPYDLSRNCRNGGRVYRLMRQLSPEAPLPEESLATHGDAKIIHRPGQLAESVSGCLDWLGAREAVDHAVAVLSGGVCFEDSVLARGAYDLGPVFDWRSAVLREFVSLRRKADNEKWLTFTAEDDEYFERLRTQLSRERLPTKADIKLVRRCAALFVPDAPEELRHHAKGAEVAWRPLRSRRGSDMSRMPLRLQVPSITPPGALACIALWSGAWAKALPPVRQVRFAPYTAAEPGAIPVYSVGEIKGLERDVVLFVSQGDAPEPVHEAFVAISRARSLMAAAIDERALASLPVRLRAEIEPA